MNILSQTIMRIHKVLTFRKVRSYLLSGVSASRLKLEGGIHRLLLLDKERTSSLFKTKQIHLQNVFLVSNDCP